MCWLTLLVHFGAVQIQVLETIYYTLLITHEAKCSGGRFIVGGEERMTKNYEDNAVAEELAHIADRLAPYDGTDPQNIAVAVGEQARALWAIAEALSEIAQAFRDYNERHTS